LQTSDAGTADDGSRNEVLAVRYGTRPGHRGEIFLNYGVYGEPDEPLAMDYYFWVVRTPTGTVVVDCGFNAGSGGRRGRTMLCEPAEALRRLGIEPSAVDALVVTHAHYDHIGNLGLFDGVPVVMSRREFDFWTGPLGRRAQFAHSAEADDVELLRTKQLAGEVRFLSGPDGTVADGVRLVEVGGHTPGQLVVLVSTAGGEVMLASDSLHYYVELERDWPFAYVADLVAMYRGFDTISAWLAEPGHHLVPGHDPAVMDRYPALEGELAGLGVRVP
jgi:glyoxylase-like metal-dependent hydrolase (beta-lactamase superfamily II)